MTRTSTRRRYLAASAAAGLAAAAGCSDLIENYDEAEETPDENASENGSGENASEGDEPVENVDHEEAEGQVRLVEPEDGAQVQSPVTFAMEVENFQLAPAEDNQSGDGNESGAAEEGSGHLHVIVDEGCLEPGYVIPQEDGYHHLSDGGSETEIELEPGEHEICAQLGDAQHSAYAISDEITIEVVDGDGDGNETDGGNESGTDNATDE